MHISIIECFYFFITGRTNLGQKNDFSSGVFASNSLLNFYPAVSPFFTAKNENFSFVVSLSAVFFGKIVFGYF